jgi:hypothetical protein
VGAYIASGMATGGGRGQREGERVEAMANGGALADVWAVRGSDVGVLASAARAAGAGREGKSSGRGSWRACATVWT